MMIVLVTIRPYAQVFAIHNRNRSLGYHDRLPLVNHAEQNFV